MQHVTVRMAWHDKDEERLALSMRRQRALAENPEKLDSDF